MSVEEVVGSLMDHEERLHGQVDSNEGHQLLLKYKEWSKRENNDGKLLLTREEWLKKSGKGVSTGTNDYRGRDGRNPHGRSRLKCSIVGDLDITLQNVERQGEIGSNEVKQI